MAVITCHVSFVTHGLLRMPPVELLLHSTRVQHADYLLVVLLKIS